MRVYLTSSASMTIWLSLLGSERFLLELRAREVVVLLRSSDFHKHRVRNLSANSPADRSKCYSLRSRY